MQEIVADGVTGLHFAPGDAEELATRVEWAWNHPGEMNELGHAARAEYETKYTVEQNYRTLTQIYERTMRSAAQGCLEKEREAFSVS
jgi:glycosyltransferase involved in cell wall biosynthesis